MLNCEIASPPDTIGMARNDIFSILVRSPGGKKDTPCLCEESDPSAEGEDDETIS